MAFPLLRENSWPTVTQCIQFFEMLSAKSFRKRINSYWEKKGVSSGCTDCLKKLFRFCACRDHWFYTLGVSEAETCFYFMWLGDRSQESPVGMERSQQHPQSFWVEGNPLSLSAGWYIQGRLGQETLPCFLGVGTNVFQEGILIWQTRN